MTVANCTVVKYGGNVLAGATESDAMEQFASDVVQMHSEGMQPVVVHGGGPQISQLMKECGKQPEFRNGLRVTDAETIDIVRTALMEHVNPQLVAAINEYGSLSIGVSGGVSCNHRLRESFTEQCRRAKLKLYLAPPALTTDNAAMIAFAALHRFTAGQRSPLEENVNPNLSLASA